MKPYLVSLAVGLLVGGLYSLLGVRSPAPPVIALVGLLGMLAGEHAVPWLRQELTMEPTAAIAPAPRAAETTDTGDRRHD